MMRAVHAKLTAKTSETMRARIIALVHATRHLPAPELFSACWRAFLQESVGRCHGKSSTDLSRQGVHPDSQGRKREEVLRSAANHISRLPGYRLGGLLVRNAGHPPGLWHRKSNAGRFSQLLANRANEKSKAAPVRHARHDADLVHRALACENAGRRRPKPVIMAIAGRRSLPSSVAMPCTR